ncbi:guanylyl cyclase 1-like isoform X1 [Daphnia pulex]|uniref:guanylyl cyclase 1-like isoform X1 n=1 Tax=Daphnia pulex TaxID=6669 RepID=UPI001EE09755|nr:guanylyl cyclase 1-like isoform X1 [Daphnia pulex]
MNQDLDNLAFSEHQSKDTEKDVFVIELPHVEQVGNWDCGLACIQMVLSNDLAQQLCQNLSSICPDEYQNKSTWTIDLCYILNHFSMKIKYYTKTLGVNPSFSKEKFYDSYILKDEERVNQRFQEAASKGISIDTGSLEINELIHHIKQNGVAIALVDVNQLECVSCKSLVNNIGNFVRTLFNAQLSFNGHYIVICGFDTKKKLIYYRDPAVKSGIVLFNSIRSPFITSCRNITSKFFITTELCCLTFSSFERTRQAHGTDEDIILIYR